MKKLMKKITSVVLLTVILASLVACGGKEKESKGEGEEGKKATVHMLINNTDEKVEKEMDYVMKHLPEVLPNVNVELEMVPGDVQTFETKVRTMISAGGDGLDVWWERGGSYVTPILESKSALPLDKYLDKNGYWDNVIESAKIPADDGNIYAVPFEDIAYSILLYNKKIFADNNIEAPKTVEELKKCVEVLAKTDTTPIAVGAKDGWCAAMMIEGFAYSVDPEITKKIVDGDEKFSSDAYQQAATVVKDLMDMGAFSKNVALTGIDEALPMFNSGKAAIMVNGSWALSEGAKTLGDDFGYLYYPVINDKDIDNYGTNVAGGAKQNSGMMAYAGTKHPDEAAAVCQAVSELRGKYCFEEQGNPFTVYNAEKMGWKSNEKLATPVQQLSDDMQKFKFVYGMVQDVMPTAAATTAVMEDSSKFMTNAKDYTVDNYLSDMDKALKEE